MHLCIGCVGLVWSRCGSRRREENTALEQDCGRPPMIFVMGLDDVRVIDPFGAYCGKSPWPE